MKRDSIEQLVPLELVRLARFCQVAMAILNARLFVAVAMFLTAGAFAYALYQPDYVRLAAATLFGLIVFWPSLKIERGAQQQPQGDSNE